MPLLHRHTPTALLLLCLAHLSTSQTVTGGNASPSSTDATSNPNDQFFFASSSAVMPSATDAAPGGSNNDSSKNNNNSNLANYYFIFIALILGGVALSLFLLLRRRRRLVARYQRSAAPDQQRQSGMQSFGVPFSEYSQSHRNGWDNWSPERRRYWPTGFAFSRDAEREEGLDEHGHAPPPYRPKTAGSNPADQESGGGGGDGDGVTVPQSVAVSGRQDVAFKPPDYEDALRGGGDARPATRHEDSQER